MQIRVRTPSVQDLNNKTFSGHHPVDETRDDLESESISLPCALCLCGQRVTRAACYKMLPALSAAAVGIEWKL